MANKATTVTKIGKMTLVASLLFTGLTNTVVPVMAKDAQINISNATADGYNAIGALSSFSKNGNKVDLNFETGEKMQLTFIRSDIFRMYLAPLGETFLEYPLANSDQHKATITKASDAELSDNTSPSVSETNGIVTIATDKMTLEIDKATSLMKLMKADGSVVWEEAAPLEYKDGSTRQTLKTSAYEYFYGGGTQNGRFSHKGNVIKIKNENNWVDQGVASPNPFYWSTNGYGVMRNTFKPGEYDFGSKDSNTVTTTHNEKRFDAYYFVGDTPAELLKEYYTITGNPVELPEYTSYLGHLNCYNRDYWTEVSKGTRGAVKIGDKWYIESQTDNGGIKESLMGGDLSAQKIIEEHKTYDMPFGWFLPNDGYGCGYGQTATQAGDIANLKQFADYAKQKGVRTGLWTQSNLWPEDPKNPKKGERDIYKEVDSGVVAVKTDVAWVGAGYSMALNGISVAFDAITSRSGVKPNIVTLDGWAGTQRYAGIWSGDQTGGKWEYIRFHVPTYIGTSLSGQPNIGSDMDGIFGGQDKVVQTRDFQWKSFTTYMLDMDGWGANQKSPWALGEDGTSINRAYLKLKAQLQPYINTISHTATTEGGLPMLRAMMLEEPNDYTLGKATQYQYMWGSNFLVAPIYEDTASDANGNDVRNNIYLPSTADTWIDYFTGKQYKGGQVINDFDAPIWKLPVFVKNGSILPRYAENNNPEAISAANPDGLDRSKRVVEFFPYKESSFKQYEDDGITLGGSGATTQYRSKVDGEKATLSAEVTVGDYANMVKKRSNEFIVHVSKAPTSVEGFTKVDSKEAYDAAEGKVYFYDEAPSPFVAAYASEGSTYQNMSEKTTPVLYIKDATKIDVTQNGFSVVINGFENDGQLSKDTLNEQLSAPTNLRLATAKPNSLELAWDAVQNATNYEIEFNGSDTKAGQIFGNLLGTAFTQKDLSYKTDYTYRIRAVNTDGYSPWSERISVQTADDPYRNVPESEVSWDYGDSWGAIENAFDHSTETMFHSTNAVTPDKMLQIDLKKAYALDRFEYTPRNDNKGNGTVKTMDVYASYDGKNWKKVYDGSGNVWTYDGENMANLDTKTIDLKGNTARYLRFSVTSSVGGFFSAAEMTVFKKDGDNGHVVGDTNNSNDVDENDLTFYENYVGLKPVDADWEYVSSLGEFNGNQNIDAFDVAYVSRQVSDAPVREIATSEKGVEGKIKLVPSKTDIKAGDKVSIDVYGIGMKNVYAFNVDFGANLDVATFNNAKATLKSLGMKNYSKVRTHSDNISENIVLFSNVGDKELINGTGAIAKVTFVAKTDFTWDTNLANASFVGKDLSSVDAKIDESVVPPLKETKNYLAPGKGISSVTFTNAHMQDNDGSLLWQQDTWESLLFDRDTTGSLAEFKWYFGNDNITKEVMLPTDFNITLDGAKYIKDFAVKARKASNGALKKSKLVAYNNDQKVFESEVISSPEPVFNINQSVTRLIWTPLESAGTTVGTTTGTETNRMLSVYELEVIEDKEVKPATISMAQTNPSKVFVGSYASLAAKVGPEEATNPYYEISSSDPETARVDKIPTTDGYVYVVEGLKAGKVTLIAKALGDESKTVTQELNVVAGVDSSVLDSELEKAEAVFADGILYTKDTLAALNNAIVEAEALSEALTTQSEVDDASVKLSLARLSMKYQGSLVDQESSKNPIDNSQLSVVSATNHADSDVKENIIDQDKTTFWHSGYQSADKLPVDVVVDLGNKYLLEQINYLARQDSSNGHITQARIEVSDDNKNFRPVVVAQFANNGNELDAPSSAKEIKIYPTSARYVKFIAQKTLGSTPNKYASIAELSFFGEPANPNIDADEIRIKRDTKTLYVTEQFNVEAVAYPFGSTRVIRYASSDDSILRVDATGTVRAIKEGEAEVIISLVNSDGKQISKVCKVKVTSAHLDDLSDKYDSVYKKVAEVKANTYNKAILNSLKAKVVKIKAIIDADPANSDDVLSALNEIATIESDLSLLPQLDAMKELIDLDTAPYDSDSLKAFKEEVALSKPIIEDALNNKDKITKRLSALQDAYNKLVLLDATSLNATVKMAQKIDLTLYLDGKVKDQFVESLANARKALVNATTNAEYDAKNVVLKDAISNLNSVKLANDATLDQINANIAKLEQALKDHKYSSANAELLKEAITKAKAAINEGNLTQLSAQDLLNSLSKVLNSTAKDTLDDNNNQSDTGSKTITADRSGISWFAQLITISGLVLLFVALKKKRSK